MYDNLTVQFTFYVLMKVQDHTRLPFSVCPPEWGCPCACTVCMYAQYVEHRHVSALTCAQ